MLANGRRQLRSVLLKVSRHVLDGVCLLHLLARYVGHFGQPRVGRDQPALRGWDLLAAAAIFEVGDPEPAPIVCDGLAERVAQDAVSASPVDPLLDLVIHVVHDVAAVGLRKTRQYVRHQLLCVAGTHLLTPGCMRPADANRPREQKKSPPTRSDAPELATTAAGEVYALRFGEHLRRHGAAGLGSSAVRARSAPRARCAVLRTSVFDEGRRIARVLLLLLD